MLSKSCLFKVIQKSKQQAVTYVLNHPNGHNPLRLDKFLSMDILVLLYLAVWAYNGSIAIIAIFINLGVREKSYSMHAL
jgi:hypothetical protein